MFAVWDIAELPDDPSEASLDICRSIIKRSDQRSRPDLILEDYEGYLEAYALLEAYLEKYGLRSPGSPKEVVVSDIDRDVESIVDFAQAHLRYLKTKSAKATVASFRHKYEVQLGATFLYEFTEGDLERIQVLLNELRDLISNSEELPEDHRLRLLRRLERLQSELHKRLSDLDRFWGLIGDAGVVLGKLASDAKPIVDRIKEIVDIVWRTQSKAEELPSGSKPPLLENAQPTEGNR